MKAEAFAAMISGLEQRGVSRPEISRRTGLSKNTVWRLANATVREPKYETIERVMDLKAKIDKIIR